MLRALSIAASGMNASQQQLDVTAQNLANAGNTGFKKSRAVFEDTLYETIRQPGGQSSDQTRLPSGLQVGTGVRMVATERLHTQGTLSSTGNQTDLAINGSGFFQVQMQDGTIAYTRDGSFQRDKDGQLVTASGDPISPAVTIPADATSVTIGRDGTVSVMRPGNTNSVQVGQIQLAMFVNPAGLQSLGENLLGETDASGNPTQTNPGLNGAGTLNQGYIEGSNVNVVDELMTMIGAQRNYEITSKAVTTADQMLQRLAQL